MQCTPSVESGKGLREGRDIAEHFALQYFIGEAFILRLFLTVKNLANSNNHVKSVAMVDARGMYYSFLISQGRGKCYIFKRRLYTLPFYMVRQCESL